MRGVRWWGEIPGTERATGWLSPTATDPLALTIDQLNPGRPIVDFGLIDQGGQRYGLDAATNRFHLIAPAGETEIRFATSAGTTSAMHWRRRRALLVAARPGRSDGLVPAATLAVGQRGCTVGTARRIHDAHNANPAFATAALHHGWR